MIITILLTLLVFSSWVFISHRGTRLIVGTLTTVLLVAMMIGLAGHLKYHWGMEKETITSEKQPIATAGEPNSPKKILIANEIGENSNHYVMVFRDHEDDIQPKTHFQPDNNKDDNSEIFQHTAHYEQADVKQATQQTTTTVWTWQSDFYRMLFSFGETKPKLIHSSTKVIVPKDDWLVLNAEEVQRLKETQQSQQSEDTTRKIKQP
ncbi:DUF4811 domain-containing protein [Staphylococcus delphini]|uniref:DUF4811 domain-containing protein n=1 Tax=Staphylococcus delphini TaxID=53344 RepID=UPI001363BB2E|nr:DUF4811 domain-containing protein [Staphylococcus delphini]NBK46769.1 DUF4811 domain-containing protein [Staphylococcus delphini]